MLSSRVTVTLARWLVAAYPRRWRTRYENEFVAVLENGVSWHGLVDVLIGALDAWITEVPGGLRGSGGEHARAVVVYVVALVAAFAALRTVAGPGRLDIGLIWAVAYSAGYVALCLVLRAITRSSRVKPDMRRS